MSDLDRKILEECCKKVLLDMSMKSRYLKENTTFVQQAKICDKITKMNYVESVSYIFNNGVLLDEFGIRDFEAKFRKVLKYGLAGAAGGIGGFVGTAGFIAGIGTALVAVPLAMFVYYLFRKATDPCWQACLKKFGNRAERSVCKHECQTKAAQKVLTDIRADVAKCPRTKNPVKCMKSLQDQLIKWKQRVDDELVQLRQAKEKLAAKRG